MGQKIRKHFLYHWLREDLFGEYTLHKPFRRNRLARKILKRISTFSMKFHSHKPIFSLTKIRQKRADLLVRSFSKNSIKFLKTSSYGVFSSAFRLKNAPSFLLFDTRYYGANNFNFLLDKYRIVPALNCDILPKEKSIILQEPGQFSNSTVNYLRKILEKKGFKLHEKFFTHLIGLQNAYLHAQHLTYFNESSKQKKHCQIKYQPIISKSWSKKLRLIRYTKIKQKVPVFFKKSFNKKRPLNLFIFESEQKKPKSIIKKHETVFLKQLHYIRFFKTNLPSAYAPLLKKFKTVPFLSSGSNIAECELTVTNVIMRSGLFENAYTISNLVKRGAFLINSVPTSLAETYTQVWDCVAVSTRIWWLIYARFARFFSDLTSRNNIIKIKRKKRLNYKINILRRRFIFEKNKEYKERFKLKNYLYILYSNKRKHKITNHSLDSSKNQKFFLSALPEQRKFKKDRTKINNNYKLLLDWQPKFFNRNNKVTDSRWQVLPQVRHNVFNAFKIYTSKLESRLHKKKSSKAVVSLHKRIEFSKQLYSRRFLVTPSPSYMEISYRLFLLIIVKSPNKAAQINIPTSVRLLTKLAKDGGFSVLPKPYLLLNKKTH